MRILIFASPRSGSTALSHALSKLLKLPEILEPFNPLNIKNLTEQEVNDLKYKIPKDCIVKVLSKHRPRDYFLEYIAYFDKVIFLTRNNILAAYESFYRSLKLNDIKQWHLPYMFDSSTHKKDKPIFNHIKTSTEEVKLVAYLNKKSYIIYEDLYSDNINNFNNTFKSFELDIDKERLRKFLDPKRKYRKPYKPKTLL